MILKEFRQMRRDRRTMALMIGLPIMMLIIFGYAARFDVASIPTAVVGPDAEQTAAGLDPIFDVVEIDTGATGDDAHDLLRNADVRAAVVTGGSPNRLLLDGTELFSSQTALAHLPDATVPQILFNPGLDTSTVMVPSLIGLILLFVGTVVTSLGVVRERDQGTLEQLAVMPLRPIDVVVGKIAPYFVVAAADMLIVTAVGIELFDVPFRGSILMYALFGVVFLFIVLGLGVAISTLSRSQGEAIQLALMVLLPQIMLSGMIFPLSSMPALVRWVGYALPLTWFIGGMRGVFLRGSDASALLGSLGILVVIAVVVFGVALRRFRRDLAPRAIADDAETPTLVVGP